MSTRIGAAVLLLSLPVAFLAAGACAPRFGGGAETGLLPAEDEQFQGSYVELPYNVCPVELPAAWQVVECLDSAYLHIREERPALALSEIEWALRLLQFFECVDESESEDLLRDHVQTALIRARLLVQRMDFKKAMELVANSRLNFELYFEVMGSHV